MGIVRCVWVFRPDSFYLMTRSRDDREFHALFGIFLVRRPIDLLSHRARAFCFFFALFFSLVRRASTRRSRQKPNSRRNYARARTVNTSRKNSKLVRESRRWISYNYSVLNAANRVMTRSVLIRGKSRGTLSGFFFPAVLITGLTTF